MAPDSENREGVENVCSQCDNKELCPVFNGQSCLLVGEHENEISAKFGIITQHVR